MKNIEKKLVKRINKISAALSKDYNHDDWTLKMHSYTFMFTEDGIAVVMKITLFNSITGEIEIYKASFNLDASIDYIRGYCSSIIHE